MKTADMETAAAPPQDGVMITTPFTDDGNRPPVSGEVTPPVKRGQKPEPAKDRVWSELFKTDPAYTKKFDRPGFKGDAINPMWRFQRMTETFGPCGIGWGMEEPSYEYITAGGQTMIYCSVGIWYVDPATGRRSELVWGEGGDIVNKNRRDGTLAVDDEARKKCFTDALGNAMKAIGLGGSVYMNFHTDDKYVSALQDEIAEKKQEQAESADEQWAQALLDAVSDAGSLEGIDALTRHHKARFEEVRTRNRGLAMRVSSRVAETRKKLAEKEPGL